MDAPEMLGEVAEVLVSRSEPERAALMTFAAEKFVREFGRPPQAMFADPGNRAAALRTMAGDRAYEAAASHAAELDVRGAFEEALAALD
jgi:hypothetical protein